MAKPKKKHKKKQQQETAKQAEPKGKASAKPKRSASAKPTQKTSVKPKGKAGAKPKDDGAREKKDKDKGDKKGKAKTKGAAKASKAKASADAAFTGFPKDAFQFLAELALNNEREWFEANRDRYEASVREPALALIRAMKPKLAKVSPHFMAVDKKAGGSLMKINRDLRFAKDKSPYKTTVGIQFRHTSDDDAPGFYVQVAPDGCFVGIGMWGPEPDALAKIRARIDADPKAWKKATAGPKFVEAFTRSGESLKRPPKGFAEDHPFVEDLKRKHHIASANVDAKDLQSGKAVDRLATLFTLGSDYIRFQCEALGVPF
jgi:uncharacterized protein (TIGR02453 family)